MSSLQPEKALGLTAGPLHWLLAFLLFNPALVAAAGEPVVADLGLRRLAYDWRAEHIPTFDEEVAAMKPHLLALNLNGMISHGDELGHKTLYLAEGDRELAMLEAVLESGWRGSVGILDHLDATDSAETLRLNLRGLDWLVAELHEPGSGGPRPFEVPSPTRRTGAGNASSSGGDEGRSGAVVVANKPEYRQPPDPEETRPKETSSSQRNTPEPAQEASLEYVKKETRELTRRASVEATIEELGRIKAHPWMGLSGAEPVFGPGGDTALEAAFDNSAGWSEIAAAEDAWGNIDAVWLYRTLEAEQERTASFWIGSRAPVAIRLNGGPLHSRLGPPGWLADQISNMNEPVVLEGRLRAGPNHLSIKFDQPAQFYFGILPLEKELLDDLEARLARDFPPAGEERYYRIETIAVPEEIVLEVGGLGFQPDGSLMICTRRGEVWNRKEGRWTLFASGLHEPLGLWSGKDGEIVVMQRSELTRIVDRTGDGRADLFETINADCGVSASQHAYIFGPVRDSEGNFWGAISALGATPGGDYFGWSFKVTPEGEFIPWSSGLRSPNGLVMTPEGDLFIADNQGEYVATSPLHHVSKGAFHGHPLGLRWDPDFSGDPYQAPIEQLRDRAKPAAVLFPYGSMGQSLAEPAVDGTGGKFGPFAGQMYIADQTKANIMRVVLEKVNGEFQGACFPFRSGFQSGNNRLAFAPDGSLYVGQTDRGWGSIGGRGYGLERVVWTGQTPFELYSMHLTPRGFQLVFTKPLDAAGAKKPEHYSLQHYYYAYQPRYGSPQTGHTPVSIAGVVLDADQRSVWIEVGQLVPGRIYELNLGEIRAADGSELVHSTAYYTLNYLIEDQHPISSRH